MVLFQLYAKQFPFRPSMGRCGPQGQESRVSETSEGIGNTNKELGRHWLRFSSSSKPSIG